MDLVIASLVLLRLVDISCWYCLVAAVTVCGSGCDQVMGDSSCRHRSMTLGKIVYDLKCLAPSSDILVCWNPILRTRSSLFFNFPSIDTEVVPSNSETKVKEKLKAIDGERVRLIMANINATTLALARTRHAHGRRLSCVTNLLC